MHFSTPNTNVFYITVSACRIGSENIHNSHFVLLCEMLVRLQTSESIHLVICNTVILSSNFFRFLNTDCPAFVMFWALSKQCNVLICCFRNGHPFNDRYCFRHRNIPPELEVHAIDILETFGNGGEVCEYAGENFNCLGTVRDINGLG